MNTIARTDRCIEYDIKLQVTKRKYEIDTTAFSQFLRSYKTLSNKQIADAMDLPLTLVEHWFRSDKYSSIPLPEHWMELKQLLNINSNEYDNQVMEFVTMDNVFEMAGRVYDSIGIAPTIKASGEIKIIERNNSSGNDTKRD